MIDQQKAHRLCGLLLCHKLDTFSFLVKLFAFLFLKPFQSLKFNLKPITVFCFSELFGLELIWSWGGYPDWM